MLEIIKIFAILTGLCWCFVALAFFGFVRSGHALTCLNCDAVSDPRLCTHITMCFPGEKCGMETFISSDGDLQYNLGCVDKNTCAMRAPNTTSNNYQYFSCNHCCDSGDLCNAYGCNSTGFPLNRGPICYSCDALQKGYPCHRIAHCETHEVCFNDAHLEFQNEMLDTSGCRSRHHCASEAIDPEIFVGRRTASICTDCCKGDLCNVQCSQTSLCSDDPNCKLLMSSYDVCKSPDVANKFCKKTCNLCASSGMTSCFNSRLDCANIGTTICDTKQVAQKYGCLQYCGYCSVTTKGPGSLSTTPSSPKHVTPSAVPTTVDGVWSQWMAWSACSVTCGNGGIQTRQRNCAYPILGAPHGKPCTGNNSESRTCGDTNNTPCPVDGIWLTWSSWTSCTATCGGGTANRRRTCYFQGNVPHGSPCVGSSTKQTTCNSDPCPVDGVWSQWMAWSVCSVTCGNRGTQRRQRHCTYQNSDVPRGETCIGNTYETRTCSDKNNTLCAVDGVWLTWSSWTFCTATCGGGSANRRRECHFQAHTPQGSYCVGLSREQKTCNSELCPVDGIWGDWAAWSACSATCNLGKTTRERNCTYAENAPRGQICTGKSLQTKFCRDTLCAVDGVWSQWMAWSACSVTCGNGGIQRRQRICSYPIPGAPHGKMCIGNTFESRTCGDKNKNNTLCAATTTIPKTTLPTVPRSCFVCQGPPLICEKVNFPEECPPGNGTA